MKFRVTGNFDMKVIPKLLAHECNQFVCILERPRAGHSVRPVTAQHDQALNALVAVGFQDFTQHFPALRHAGNMRGYRYARIP